MQKTGCFYLKGTLTSLVVRGVPLHKTISFLSLTYTDFYTRNSHKGSCVSSRHSHQHQITWNTVMRSLEDSPMKSTTLDGSFLGTTLPDVSHLHNNWRKSLLCHRASAAASDNCFWSSSISHALCWRSWSQILKWTQYARAWDQICPCQVPNILCTSYLSTDPGAMYCSWLSLYEGQVSVAAWDKRFWRSSTSYALRWDSWSKSLGGQAWFYLASISHIASYSVIIHPRSV